MPAQNEININPLAALDACARLRKGRSIPLKTNPCVLVRFFQITIIHTPIFVVTDFGNSRAFKTGDNYNQSKIYPKKRCDLYCSGSICLFVIRILSCEK